MVSKTRRRGFKVTLEVAKVTDGLCPYYVQGQKVVWYGGRIAKDESDDICMPMLYTFAPFWKPLSNGKTPKEIGMCKDGDVGYFTCHVCPVGSTPPRQSHANVLFKVTTRPMTEAEASALSKIADQGPNAARLKELKKRGLWYPPYWPIEGI